MIYNTYIYAAIHDLYLKAKKTVAISLSFVADDPICQSTSECKFHIALLNFIVQDQIIV